jgi:hypothetical protein
MSAQNAVTLPDVPSEVRDYAKQAGGGWLDEVVGDWDVSAPVPPHAVKGSWKLDAGGDLTGEYEPNPQFGRIPGRCPLHAPRRR